MCPEIWKLMKFFVAALIWLILAAPNLVAAEGERSFATNAQIASSSNLAPASFQHPSQARIDTKEKK